MNCIKEKSQEEKPIKTVYCLYRVSTLGQVDKDDIPMQKHSCREFAKRQPGWVIKKEFQEKGVSGYKVSANDRDAVQELKIAAENKEFDVLLVFMFDRIGRIDNETPFVVEWFIQHGIEVWNVNEGEQRMDSHVDKLMNYIRFWQANGESQKTSMRVKARLQQLVAEGVYTGGCAPFGYTLVKSGEVNKKGKELKTFEINQTEATMVKKIFELTVNEGYGTYVMAEYVNNHKMLTHNGAKFQSNTIKRILSNPLYCGYYVRGGVQSPRIEHLQIIDDETFQQAQNILKQRSKSGRERSSISTKTKSETMLGENLYCAHCGNKLYSSSYNDTYTTVSGEKKTVKRYRYICAGHAMKRNSCDGQSAYTAHKIDTIVINALGECFKKIKATSRDIALENKYEIELKIAKEEIRKLQRELEVQNKKLGDLTEEIANSLVGESKFTPDVLAIAIEGCKDKISNIKEIIAQKERLLNSEEETLKRIDYYYNQFLGWADEFEQSSLEKKKMICCTLFSVISVGKGCKVEILMNSSNEQFLKGIT